MSRVSIWYNKLRKYLLENWPRLYTRLNNRKAVVKFIIAGLTATGTDLFFLYLFRGVWHWNLILAASLAFIIAFFVSFSLQKLWTFRNRRLNKIWSQLSLYFLNALLGLVVNAYLIHFLAVDLKIWYLLAQFIVSIMIAFWNFMVYKFIIFKYH